VKNIKSSFNIKADGKNSNQLVLKGLRQFLITDRKAERGLWLAILR
jgi:hypothetical protein